jgi:hypothetical protein
MGADDETHGLQAGAGGDTLQRLTATENLALGVSAGIIEVSLLQPMLYCKNATQQGLPLTLNPAILYRGVGMSIINMAVITGAQFPLTGLCTKLVTGGEPRALSSAEKIGTGFMGGAISGFLCAPMELVMIQQQRHGESLIHQTRRVMTNFGVSGLFRGLFTACGREGLFTAGYLGIGPVFADKLKNEGYISNPKVASLVGAAGAGCIAATLSHPLDTVKTCMQGDVEQRVFKSMPATASALYAEGGTAAFFRGWSWRTSRMIMAIFIMGQCKDVLSPIFFPYKFKEHK